MILVYRRGIGHWVALSAVLTAICLLTVIANQAHAADERTSFFITSEGKGEGANLGGLEGADAHCTQLAEAAGISGKVWRAYLSTSGDDAVNARDRIGTGPWHNSTGVMIARDLDHLHSEDAGIGKQTSLTEKGDVVNGLADKPNMHDILTGSLPDGTANLEYNLTCSNWTTNGKGKALVGHHDRVGGGAHPKQWNSAHVTWGCSQTKLQGSGGTGLFYCFAEN